MAQPAAGLVRFGIVPQGSRFAPTLGLAGETPSAYDVWRRLRCVANGADCGVELWHVDGIKVRHNSIWRPEQNWNRGIRVGAGTMNTEIVNNLIHGSIQMEGGEARVDHNLTKRLDDYFFDPANGDLALTSRATEAVDHAAPVKEVPADIRGRPRRNAPDLGAWEQE